MKDSFPTRLLESVHYLGEHRFLITVSPSPQLQYRLRYRDRQSLLFTIVAINYRLPFVPELHRYHVLVCLRH